MSYRSDVAVALREADFNRFQEAVKARIAEDPEFDRSITHGIDNKVVRNGIVVLKWGWWPWDENDEDIAFLFEFLNETGKYQYVRIGEDIKDIEYVNSADFSAIWPVSEIAFDF